MVPDNTILSSVYNISLTTVLTWLYLALVVTFFVHWLIASYHWYVFGSERTISLLSIIVYGVGGIFFLTVMGGLLLFM